MRKSALYIIGVIIALLPLSGCLHNNGDIGPWFGQWKVESIEKNGEVAADYQGDGFLRFQSEVITAVRSYPSVHSSGTDYGNFVDNGSTMDVEFKEGKSIRNYLHLEEKFTFNVLKRDGSDKLLEYTDSKGDTYTYHLKKW